MEVSGCNLRIAPMDRPSDLCVLLGLKTQPVTAMSGSIRRKKVLRTVKIYIFSVYGKLFHRMVNPQVDRVKNFRDPAGLWILLSPPSGRMDNKVVTLDGDSCKKGT